MSDFSFGRSPDDVQQSDVARGRDRLRVLPVAGTSAVCPVCAGVLALAVAAVCYMLFGTAITPFRYLPPVGASARSRAACCISVFVLNNKKNRHCVAFCPFDGQCVVAPEKQ